MEERKLREWPGDEGSNYCNMNYAAVSQPRKLHWCLKQKFATESRLGHSTFLFILALTYNDWSTLWRNGPDVRSEKRSSAGDSGSVRSWKEGTCESWEEGIKQNQVRRDEGLQKETVDRLNSCRQIFVVYAVFILSLIRLLPVFTAACREYVDHDNRLSSISPSLTDETQLTHFRSGPFIKFSILAGSIAAASRTGWKMKQNEKSLGKEKGLFAHPLAGDSTCFPRIFRFQCWIEVKKVIDINILTLSRLTKYLFWSKPDLNRSVYRSKL